MSVTYQKELTYRELKIAERSYSKQKQKQSIYYSDNVLYFKIKFITLLPMKKQELLTWKLNIDVKLEVTAHAYKYSISTERIFIKNVSNEP